MTCNILAYYFTLYDYAKYKSQRNSLRFILCNLICNYKSMFRLLTSKPLFLYFIVFMIIGSTSQSFISLPTFSFLQTSIHSLHKHLRFSREYFFSYKIPANATDWAFVRCIDTVPLIVPPFF